MKRKIKRTVSAMLACVLLLALLPASALAAGSWAAGYMKNAVDNGWIGADQEASTDKEVTRAEFAVILWKALGSPAAQGECPFTDVTGDEAKAAVAALSEKGVVSGDGAAFNPNGTLTREAGILMLVRAFGLEAADKNAAASFADWADVADYAKDAMAAAVEKGIVAGVGGNRLAPGQTLTLGQVTKLTDIASAVGKTALISADDAIESVSTLGFVDVDGSKAYAIVIKYNVDLTGAEVSLDDFAIEDYGLTLSDKDLDSGSEPGKPLKIYVNNEPATSENGGSGTGNYVIIEINTNFTVSRFPRSWKVTVFAGVEQTAVIKTDAYTITPSTEKKINYEEFEYIGINPMTGGLRDPEYYNYALDGTYIIEGIEDYELHTIEDQTAFYAEHCFEEADGNYYDFWLPYALYVPEDYDPNLEYALVLHIHDAGSMSSDPRLTLTEAQGPANYASDRFQQLAKDQGLGGAIVVCPAIAEMFDMDGDGQGEFELRISRDNWTLSCGSQAVWKLMDHLTETYSIDTNRIYGSGQSMGGMTVMAMAAQRDNYFAALLPMSCQWGQNFDKGYEFNGKVYYNAPADNEVIYDTDADGNAYDYNNWYYVCSDDNILFLWTEEYPEYRLLYHDLCGVEVESTTMLLDSEHNTTDAERSALIKELVSRESDLGLRHVYLTGTVGHMSAWFYGHGTSAVYEWLLSQTRETEMAREKLDLNKPFVLADEQLKDELHVYSNEKDGSTIYFPTGAAGSGTQGYNSACSALGSQAKLYPGWPDNVMIDPAPEGYEPPAETGGPGGGGPQG